MAVFLVMVTAVVNVPSVYADVFVANGNGNSITVYNDSDTGNVTPIRTITGASTGLNMPRSVFADAGYLYVANAGGSITVYNLTDNGNVAPQRTISGANTGLNSPYGIFADAGYLYVTNAGGPSITVYNLTDNGNVAPQRTISGANTGLNSPYGIFADAGYLYVTNAGGPSITVYNLTDNGNVAPQRTIFGASTGLSNPEGIFADASYLYVTNYSVNSIRVYNLTDNGNVAPQRTISGAMINPHGIFKAALSPAVTSVSSTTANGSYASGAVIHVTVTFSQAVNVTGTPQLTLETGTTDAVVNYTSGSGTATLTFDYTVSPGDTSADLDYTLTSALSGGTIKDTATGTKDAILTLPAPGAANSLGGSKAIVIDTTAPTLAEVTAVPATTNDATPDYTFSSSEAGTITYTGDCSSATTAAVSGSNTVTFITLSAGAHSNCKIRVTDSAGNASADLAVSSFTVDTVAPTVTINQAGAQADPATAPPINFTVVFSESVTGFDDADVTLSGIAGATGTVTGSGTTYNVAVSGMTAAGTLTATIAAGVAADSAGNGNAASTFTDNAVIYSPPPASVVSINRAGTDPTNAVSVTFTVTFSESMSGIDIADFALALTGTASGTIASVSAASGTSITVTVNSVTGDGTLGLNLTDNDSIVNGMSVPLGGAGAGNGNFTTGQTYTVDRVAPTVTINQESSQADPANSSPINFTVVFSESVTGFDAADVTLSGIAGATGTVTGSGTTYNVAVSGMTAAGTLTATIAAGVAADSAGNGNAASTFTDNAVIYSPPPASVVSINRAGTDPTNAVSVTFTVTFSESMSGIDIADFALALTGTASGTIASVSAVSGISITVTVNTVTGDGTLGLNLIDDDSITNSMSVKLGGTGTTGAGNGSFTGQTYTIDHTAPTVVLSSTATDPTGSSPFSVTATFSESVTGFVIGDIAVGNGSAGNFSGSGTTYTFDVTPAGDVVVTVNVAANAAQDSVGNNSTAATALTRTYDHTLTAPAYGSSALLPAAQSL